MAAQADGYQQNDSWDGASYAMHGVLRVVGLAWLEAVGLVKLLFLPRAGGGVYEALRGGLDQPYFLPTYLPTSVWQENRKPYPFKPIHMKK
jgi:hypothetical protein